VSEEAAPVSEEAAPVSAERRVLELARAVVQEDPDLGALAMREATSAEESASWHRKPKTGAAALTKGSSVKKGLSVLPAPTAAHRALYMALGGEAVGEAHVSLSTSGVARCMRELAAAVAMVGCVPPSPSSASPRSAAESKDVVAQIVEDIAVKVTGPKRAHVQGQSTGEPPQRSSSFGTPTERNWDNLRS